jgi:uncharacterized protein YllA (UPF0747 family)
VVERRDIGAAVSLLVWGDTAILERQNRAGGASQRTLENIVRLRNGASALVTGQQVGLFGGPLFSLFKALTTVKRQSSIQRGLR